MAVTIRDIAKRLNLSHSTVSRIINNRDSEFISPATRERVRQTAAELGYRPNYHARSLQTGRANAIGLILNAPEPNSASDRFWQFMVTGISTGARAHGYDLLVIGPVRGQTEDQRGLQYLQERRVDALIVPGYLGVISTSPLWNESDAPIVFAAGGPVDSPHPVVDLDAAPGIEAAIDHLGELGHRRILWFDVQPDEPVALERRVAFRKAIQRRALRGIEVCMGSRAELQGNGEVELARKRFPEALKRLPEATAVICFNEATAFGVYAAAVDCGLNVPRDLSVIGFDDIHGDMASPAMTVVSHMLHEIGMKAAELAVKRVESSTKTKFARRRERVAAELIVRKSTVTPQRIAGPTR